MIAIFKALAPKITSLICSNKKKEPSFCSQDLGRDSLNDRKEQQPIATKQKNWIKPWMGWSAAILVSVVGPFGFGFARTADGLSSGRIQTPNRFADVPEVVLAGLTNQEYRSEQQILFGNSAVEFEFREFENYLRQAETTNSSVVQVQIPEFYTVVEGDTLYSIAEKYLGDGDKYPEIFKINEGKLNSPDQLAVGMQLRLRPPTTTLDVISTPEAKTSLTAPINGVNWQRLSSLVQIVPSCTKKPIPLI